MRNSAIKTVPWAAAMLLAVYARAGSLTPGLEATVAGMGPGEVVDVIIRCVDPLDPASIVPSELIPALRNKAAACEKSLTGALHGPATVLWIINGIAATVPVASLEGLAHRAGVDSIYLNERLELPPDPELAGIPGDEPVTYWNISEIRAPELWAMGHYGTGVVVATMDSGVDAAHADIGPQWRGGNNSWYDPHGEHDTPFDADGHGTRVMGLIVGGNAGGFDIGVAPDTRWIAVKLFDDAGQSDLAKAHQGLQWLLDPDGNGLPDDAPRVVNNSWIVQGTEGECFGEFAADIAALRAADISVVSAAGNSGPKPATSMEPANDGGSLAVGAIDSSLKVTRFSSRGPSACDGGLYPRLAAPGKDVLTADLTSGGANPTSYTFATGTSFSAPVVAGAVALLKSAVPTADTADIEMALEATAFDLAGSGADNDTGAGLIDLVGAYLMLIGSAPTEDADQDGIADESDLCPGTPAGETVDAVGCAESQLDADGDGVGDARDLCPGTPSGETVDADGCADSQLDEDGDGVGDALDLCPGTPSGETVDADGCAESQLDADGDGVGDARDLCPGTPAGETVDADGCPLEPSDADGDGDGFSVAADCDDGDASTYPGAPEVKHDGIDQDCNGYDLTIDITFATYITKGDGLNVEATSTLGGDAALEVVGFGPMKWERKQGYWSYSARNIGGHPGVVTVSGPEGTTSASVQ